MERVNRRVILIINVILFGLISILFYSLVYPFHLYYQEQIQLFQFTSAYWKEYIIHPGGFIGYLGAFVTQFYYFPRLGGVIVSLLLVLLFILTYRVARLLKLGNLSSVFLSWFVGFLFLLLHASPLYKTACTLAVLLSLALLCLYFSIHSYSLRYVFGGVVCLVLNPLIGGAYLIFVFCCVLFEAFVKKERHYLAVAFAYVAIGLTVPVFNRYTLYTASVRNSYLSDFYYEIPEWPDLDYRSIINFDQQRIFRQIYYANNGEWELILEDAKQHPPVNKWQLSYVNLALAKTGRIASDLFLFEQFNEHLFCLETKDVISCQISSDVYWHIGYQNYSRMAAFMGTQMNKRPEHAALLYRLAEIEVLNSNFKLADKYISIFENTLFYKQKARALHLMMEDKESSEYVDKRKFIPSTDKFSVINSSMFVTQLNHLLEDNPQNKNALEVLLSVYFIKRDMESLLACLKYIDGMKYDPLPPLYQQCLLILLSVGNESIEQEYSKYSFDISKSITDDFKELNSLLFWLSQNDPDAQRKINEKYKSSFWLYFLSVAK
ncbi:hypothetical protein M2459_003288 [Parabacteroides sp. PF5-5]|uniref:DUF6057 family protein n=1 Tax=unclassified Parabacteroides TaxID=2649774 RepID=UPI002476C758|nr:MULTISPECIES: DUF6057 family protein [unclassified Parabacteroides]MDH6306563.1 hypothetical protein [Parabacteroides sp. PH5-39]MDH6317530.1 hypothetical protein [Parabacteroides sp. PF5-13]MDH6321274.1 hypothetical protein [Parabacteroides sp. PH5-13]MDH6325006.1 hypothetical protein [Parabacteroides sp. PH5-8]MDH6328715.1 hypothetical protein [Parabacteroides sp. PH5-41]